MGRQKREAYWRQRMKDARALYIQASQHHTSMVEELGRIAPKDGALAAASARRAQALARNQYARMMLIYRMTLQDKIIVLGDAEELLN